MGNGQWRSTENLPVSTTLAEYRSQNQLVVASLDELMAIPHAPLPELTSVVTINLVTAYAVTTVHFRPGLVFAPETGYTYRLAGSTEPVGRAEGPSIGSCFIAMTSTRITALPRGRARGSCIDDRNQNRPERG